MSKNLLVSVSTLLGLTSISYLSAIAPIQAQVINGDFETGDFTGWMRIETFLNDPDPIVTEGDLTSVRTSAYGTSPKSEPYQALMNFPDPNTIAFADELEEFLGLSDGTFDSLGATSGSAIKQVINVTTPSILSFSYNFLTDELETDFNDDFAFFSLSINDTVEQFFSVSEDNFSSSNTPFARETGYLDYSSPNPLPVGIYTLGLGVTNLLDFEGPSGILIDDVTLTPVDSEVTTPEPSTILASLLVLTCGALGGWSKVVGGVKRTENPAKDFLPSHANEFNRVSAFKFLFKLQYTSPI